MSGHGETSSGSAGKRRRRRVLPRLGSWIGAAVLVVATVAAGRAIISYTSDVDAHTRPFVRTGAEGESVDARTFSVRVVAIRGAATIERRNQYYDDLSREAKSHDTSGVWVLVRVRVVALDEPTTIGYAAVRDARGRTYIASDRISQPLLGGWTLQPGVPLEGEFVFEVPRESATSLAFRIGQPMFDQRMAAVAEVPLTITRPTVDRWLAESRAAVVGEPVVVR